MKQFAMGRAMDPFQFVPRDREAGPIRQSWEEAAQDAVAAGLASWVWQQFPNSRAIQWAVAGLAAIKNVPPGR